MKIKFYLFILSLLYFSFLGYGQSGKAIPVEVDSTHAVRSLVELKALVLKGEEVQRTGTVNVPTAHRALFCRFDDKLDKKKIPLRMRLGSLEEVNRMESKPGFRTGQLPN